MKFVWHNNQWMPAVRMSRPSVFPAIISDQMGALLHPATGVTTDSKSEFRRMTRAAGYEEVGNEVDAHLAPQQADTSASLEGDIAQAWEMVEQGYQPPPLDTAEAGIRIL